MPLAQRPALPNPRVRAILPMVVHDSADVAYGENPGAGQGGRRPRLDFSKFLAAGGPDS
jgi:hypothetical protein